MLKDLSIYPSPTLKNNVRFIQHIRISLVKSKTKTFLERH